ncbi:MAG: alpha/beta fold hydrolase [Phycisphaerales bacterium JB040]
MPTFEFRSRAIAYEHAGRGRPLVFQHGLGSEKNQILELFRGVPGLGVLTADAPSHADSEHAPELHSFGAMADALLALMDREGIDRACVGGLSMGAGVALNLCLRHPDRVSGLVLLRPAWLHTAGPDNLALIARLGAWVRDSGPARALERLENDPAFRTMRERVPGAADSVVHALRRNATPEAGRVLADLVADAPYRSPGELAGVTQPALVIASGADPLHPVSVAEELATALPNATLLTAPERYVRPAAHAERVREAVREFVGGLEEGPGQPA